MAEFWEDAFSEKQEMWGLDYARSAVLANDLFVKNGVKTVLIPGIGYGRNAGLFLENGMTVTGIEISRTAIDLAEKHFGNALKIHHGSVSDMPFDQECYDGIFCHALLHLLNKDDRRKLIADCYGQLCENGHMLFSVITKAASTYGKGVEVGKDRFEMFGGVQMFFYDRQTIEEEFSGFGRIDVLEIEENYPFYLIICKK